MNAPAMYGYAYSIRPSEMSDGNNGHHAVMVKRNGNVGMY